MSVLDILIRERARVVRLVHAGTGVSVLAVAAAVLVLAVASVGLWRRTAPPAGSHHAFGGVAGHAAGKGFERGTPRLRVYQAAANRSLEEFDALIDRAERRYAAGDRAGGMRDLAEVATSSLPPPLRAWAAARLSGP